MARAEPRRVGLVQLVVGARARGARVGRAADPHQTQKRAAAQSNESETEAHDFWLEVVETSEGGTPASVASVANARDAASIIGARNQTTPFNLRTFIQKFIDRPRSAKRLRRENNGGSVTYYVEALAVAARNYTRVD